MKQKQQLSSRYGKLIKQFKTKQNVFLRTRRRWILAIKKSYTDAFLGLFSMHRIDAVLCKVSPPPLLDTSVGSGADAGLYAVSPAVAALGLLSARPAVTFPAEERHRPLASTKLYCLVIEAHVCAIYLPSVVTWKWNGRKSNRRPFDRESNA